MHYFSKSLLGAFAAVPVAAALALLAGAPSAHAQVKAGDTFTFDISGYNSTGSEGAYIASAETATFGATTTFTGIGANGQNITITSGETKSGATTTDTFTVSTPTNFFTGGTFGDGAAVTQLYFDLGDANSGSNTVDLLAPIATYTASGSILYGSTNTFFGFTPVPVLSNGNASYAVMEGVSTGTTAISTLAVHSFTFGISYTTAPEPSAVLLSISGGFLTVGGLVRRRRRAK